MGDRGSEASGGFGQGDDELFQFLEQKRKEVAAMTQAAEIAREQALQLLRLQQEVARIDRITESGLEGTTYSEQVAERTSRPQRGTSSGVDALMGSTALGSVGELPTTTLSLEDRRRFGLDGTPPPSEVPPSRSDTVVQVEAEVPTVTFEVPAAQEEVSDAPAWSSLSAEDRMRFGLEGGPPTGPVPG
ncbi:unnamed protein product [Durusdinium trenchii]|uniref:Uncharacterized protein n=1 Tax=Durusdinium trenchii TaxID=1381693 RepID=A0ABP0L5P2_9DINO